MPSTAHTTDSPRKRNFSNKFLNSGSPSGNTQLLGGGGSSSAANAGPTKLTYSQRKSMEKEEEDFNRMFQLFENKAEVEYLNSTEDDKLAASVYQDAKRSATNSGATAAKPHTSGYDFGELLKNEPDIGLHQSWSKY
jgi:hypothetical protein